ncbi:hypothetical protein PSTT_02552 [Puccinia striiformis]|uniref:Uncharacterized protein n=1 Tax=Puccinia striiformis TaxID=27350 RepID=A0A2S4VZT5_9BASI|nr:hypothetical protein PSTT_02552 [Puccinia striiformis]
MVVRSMVSLIVPFALRQAQRDAVIAIGNTSSGYITRPFFLHRSPSARLYPLIIFIKYPSYNVIIPCLQYLWPLGPKISHQRSLRSSFAHLRRFGSACFGYLYCFTYCSTPATTIQVIQLLEVVPRSRRAEVNSLRTPAVPSISPG